MRQHSPELANLTARLWLLGALSVVLLPHLLRLAPWLIPFCLALLGWRLGMDLRGWSLPGRWLRLVLTLFGIAIVLATYRTLLGRDAGLALLSVMLCLKLLETRSLRDAMLIVFLGYFLIAGGFLFSQSLLMGGYLLVVVLILTAALIALNHPAATPQLTRLYLHRAGALLLQALPIALVLFLLFPRLPGPLWGLPKDAFAGRTGISDHMTLGNITELADSEEVAFRVQFEGPTPPAQQLYWRGPVLWYTDGRRWDPIKPEQAPTWFKQAPMTTTSIDALRYTLTLEPNNQPWVFALELPTQVPSALTISADFQVRLARAATTRQRFELSSYSGLNVTQLTAAERELALHLPMDRNPRTLALAQQWRALPPQQIVARALALFREDAYFYTRRPPPLGNDAIDEFLFETRRGFCEHYAAAFTTLMRAAGLPARVVTGYQGGESNPLDAYLIVRQSRAHAWSEVYLPQSGWTRVDPTAVIPSSRVESDADLARFNTTMVEPLYLADMAWLGHSWSRLRYGWDALNNAWNQWVLGYDHQRQLRLLERLGILRFGWGGIAAILISVIALVLSVVGSYLLFKQGRRTPPPVIALYQEFCRRLARIGLARRTDEGPHDYMQRICIARPDLGTQVSHIQTLYVALRYRAVNDTDVIEQLRKAVAAFRPRLKA